MTAGESNINHPLVADVRKLGNSKWSMASA